MTDSGLGLLLLNSDVETIFRNQTNRASLFLESAWRGLPHGVATRREKGGVYPVLRQHLICRQKWTSRKQAVDDPTKRCRNQNLMSHSRRRITNLAKCFWMLVMACALSPAYAVILIPVRLELISAEFGGELAYGTFYLRESDTGLPIAGMQVAVKLNTTREDSGWHHYATSADGSIHFSIPRLRDSKGVLWDQSQLIGEFNVRRSSSDPGRQLYADYKGVTVARTVPMGSLGAPVAIISAPIQSGDALNTDCLTPNAPVRFESLSYSQDSPDNAPNSRIDDWHWTITDPFGQRVQDTGPAVNFQPKASGEHQVELVIWDHNGRVGRTSRLFKVHESGFITNNFGGPEIWGQCPPVSSSGPSLPTPLLTDDPNGKLEIQCITDACFRHAFRLRWHPTVGPAVNIAQCSYNAGENHGVAIWDVCKGRYSKIIWRNEEGHGGRGHIGPIVDDEHGGIRNGYADVDIYTYEPESNRLRVAHRWRSIGWLGYTVGPDQGNVVYWDSQALPGDELFCRTWKAKAPLRNPTAVDLLGNDGPSRARLLLRGTTGASSLNLRVRNFSLALPLAAGLTANQVGQRLIDAANLDPGFIAQGLSAETSDPGVLGWSEVAIVGALEEEMSISVEGDQASFLPLIPWTFPALSATTLDRSRILLSWPDRGDLFQLEMGQLTASGFVWGADTRAGKRDTRDGVVTMDHLVEEGAAAFFRLVLKP